MTSSDAQLKAASRWRQKNPLRRVKRYGLTVVDYNKLLDQQGHRCLGCQRHFDAIKVVGGKTRSPYVDHDHTTGKVRGLLCHGCNMILGFAREEKATLSRLRAYLDYDRTKTLVYVMGALKNPRVPQVASELRKQARLDVFDDWFAAGVEADSYWRQYEVDRGHNFGQALKGRAGQNTFLFDRAWLDFAEFGVLVMPAGKSAHLELGYLAGRGKRTFILVDEEPDRFDIMPQFAHKLVYTTDELLKELS